MMEFRRTHAFALSGFQDLTANSVRINFWLRSVECELQAIRPFNNFHIDILDNDDCQPNPCMNDGICVDGTNSFTCYCAHGFVGDNCSISKLKYAIQFIYSFLMIIIFHFHTIFISIDTDDCKESPCSNGGTCIDGIASYTCVCPPGSTGLNCETCEYDFI